ncbi:MAG: hypothetical protein JSS57_18770 [Proteobacteria bacterium]|nr:hypothetical protein [Pseudomonadota bacterium]
MNNWIESKLLPIVLAFAAGVLVMSVAHDEREFKQRMKLTEARQAAMECRSLDVIAYYRSMQP